MSNRSMRFSFALRGRRVAPEAGEVDGQGQDLRSFVLIEEQALGLVLAVVLLLGGTQGAQFCVPVGFQGISDEPVVGVDAQVAALGQLCLVASAFDLLPAQTVGFLGASLELFLDGERHLQGQRTDRLDQEVAGGHLIVRFAVHAPPLRWPPSAISANTLTSSMLSPASTSRGPPTGGGAAFGNAGLAQTAIQATSPLARNNARPRGVAGAQTPMAWARKTS